MRSTLILASAFILLCGTALNVHASSSTLDNAAQELSRIQNQVKVAETTGRKDLLVKELRHLRDLQTRFGAVDSAMRTSLRIVGLSGATADRSAMAEDWLAVARLGRNTEDLSQAVAAAKRALMILKTIPNNKLWDPASLELFDLLLEAKRYAEFKHLSEESLSTFRAEQNHTGQAEILYRQGECLTAEGRAADALSLLHSALRNRDDIGNEKVIAKILFALARANAKIAQWAPANAALEEALRLDPQAQRTGYELYGLRADIAEGMGNLTAALQHMRQERVVKDSINSSNIAERMARIQAMYAVRSKDEAMEELREANRETTSQLAEQKRTSQWALIGCLGISIGSLLLFLFRGLRSTTIRRVRLKNSVIVRQADEIQARSTELERQNLQLSQALIRDGNSRGPETGPYLLAGNGIRLMDLLVRTQKDNAANEEVVSAIDALHGRIRALALVNENHGKEGVEGKLQLKAHFTALANTLLREKGLLGKARIDLEISNDDIFLNDLLPLSLLLNELLQVSLAHGSQNNIQNHITIALRRLGEHQCELLYSDNSGSIFKEQFHNGSVAADLIQALVKTLDGTIMLLKGEVSSFQLTYQAQVGTELRRAS